MHNEYIDIWKSAKEALVSVWLEGLWTKPYLGHLFITSHTEAFANKQENNNAGI